MLEHLHQLAARIIDIRNMSQVDDVTKKILIFKIIQEARLTAHGHVMLEALLNKKKG